MGVALGDIGLRLDDFCALTPDEFNAIWEAHQSKEERHMKEAWEQTRMLMLYSIVPHSKKSLRPEDVLSLPWDQSKQKEVRSKDAALSQEEFNKLIEYYKD